MTLEDLKKIAMAATRFAKEAEQEKDWDNLCISCGDSFDCEDKKPTEVCNLCAQEYFEKLHPDRVLKLLAVIEAAMSFRDSLRVGRDDVSVVPFDDALRELETL